MVVVAAEREERQVLLSRALAALPSEDRLLLALRVGEQLSYDEIAGLLELNPSTVRTRLYRIRARLHRLVQQYLNEGVEGNDGLC
jgi:RNA polymerase sigma-70 factor (ECF subfamily)